MIPLFIRIQTYLKPFCSFHSQPQFPGLSRDVDVSSSDAMSDHLENIH